MIIQVQSSSFLLSKIFALALLFVIPLSEKCFSQVTSGLGLSYSVEFNEYTANSVSDDGIRRTNDFSVHNFGVTYDLLNKNETLSIGPYFSGGLSPCGPSAEYCRPPSATIVLQVGGFMRFKLIKNLFFSMEGYKLLEDDPDISLTVLKPGMSYQILSVDSGKLYANIGGAFTLYNVNDLRYFYEPMEEVSAQGMFLGMSYQWQ